MTIWLGLDIGTSSVKAVALGGEGEVIASARASYSTVQKAPGFAEQDADDYLRATADAIGQLGIDAGRIAGIGLSGQTPTAVCVDASRRCVRPAMTWQDSRAIEEAKFLEASGADAGTLFGTPLAWSPTAIPAKLQWLARHEPETVRATRWVLQPKDYLGMALTGVPSSDPWSSKGLCNVLSGEPASDFLQSLGWSEKVCPPLGRAWDARGSVSAEGAARFGVLEGTPVAHGWSDALAAMLRVGAFSEPSAFILTGTSDIVGRSFADGAPKVDGLMTIPSSCAPLPVTFGPTQSSGDAVEWLARLLGRTVPDLMTLTPGRPDAPPVFIPYLRGERAPIWNAEVRAGFSDVSVEHGAGDMVEAVLQGINLSARDILERAGTDAQTPIHIAGVSATIDRWTAARLKTLGRPMVLHDEDNASAVGAAMLGAAAAGGSLAEQVANVSRAAARVTPDEQDIAVSSRRFAAYRALSSFALARVGQGQSA